MTAFPKDAKLSLVFSLMLPFFLVVLYCLKLLFDKGWIPFPIPIWSLFLAYALGLLFLILSLFLGIKFIIKDFKNSDKKDKRIAVAGVCISLIILIIIILPSIVNVNKNSNMGKIYSIQCTANLKQLGNALNLYAADNNGFFPNGRGAEGFEKLWKGKYVTDPKLFVCPADYVTNSNILAFPEVPLTEKNVSYIYLGGGVNKNKGFSYTIIAREKLGKHKNTNHILYLNGEVGFEGTEAFK